MPRFTIFVSAALVPMTTTTTTLMTTFNHDPYNNTIIIDGKWNEGDVYKPLSSPATPPFPIQNPSAEGPLGALVALRYDRDEERPRATRPSK